jgi:hypothetical protein
MHAPRPGGMRGSVGLFGDDYANYVLVQPSPTYRLKNQRCSRSHLGAHTSTTSDIDTSSGEDDASGAGVPLLDEAMGTLTDTSTAKK